MSPRTKKQYEQIRSQKRKLILNTAMEVFAEKTFQGATISMVAMNAGISKGLIYNYFESKEDLLKEIIREGTLYVWQYFDPNHDGILTKDEFIYFIKKSLQITKENRNYWKLYSSLMLQQDVIDLIKNDYGDMSKHYYQLSYDLFRRCKIKDPDSELLLFASMIKGAIVQYVAMPEAFPIDQFEIAIVNYYKNILDI